MIRLDDEVVEWFRAKVHEMGGSNYQRVMNAALREHIAREGEPLDEALRRVLREELPGRVSPGRSLLRTIGGKRRRRRE